MSSVALVVGGTGLAAAELPKHLLRDFRGSFSKVAVLSRSVTADMFADESGVSKVIPVRGVDLTEKQSIISRLQDTRLTDITHVFWFLDANQPQKVLNANAMRTLLQMAEGFQIFTRSAVEYAPSPLRNRFFDVLAFLAGSQSNDTNILWLSNMIDALVELGAPLENFTLGTGGKHYGMHCGPFVWSQYSIPFKEDVHKCPGPLSYFDQEAFLKNASEQFGFRWNVIRPSFIIGSSPSLSRASQNLGLCLGVFIAILKARRKPLTYPGSRQNWEAQFMLSTSKKIARISAWAATGSAAGFGDKAIVSDPPPVNVINQAFNAVSSPVFTWRETWKELAGALKMGFEGPAGSTGLSCLEALGGRDSAEKTWKQLCKRHNLREIDFDLVLNSDFFDKSFSAAWDSPFSTEKLETAGYPSNDIIEGTSASEVLIHGFKELTEKKYIPNLLLAL